MKSFWTVTTHTVWAATFWGALAGGCLAQNYPVKPIRVLVGFGAGGSADVATRVAAQKLSDNLSQPVIVENKPGAAGLLAAQLVATSAPDGYTLLMSSGSDALLQALRTKLPYDLEKDFSAVSMVATTSLLLVVNPSLQVKTIKELIALAQSQPGKIRYGSSGIGGSPHFAMELLNSMAKTQTVHVPYKSGSAVVNATVAGQIEMSIVSITAAIPLLDAGRLRPIAVTTLKRASIIPSVPTIDESGLPTYNRSSWYGILAPAGVQRNIIVRLNTVLDKALNTADTKELLNKHSLDVQTGSPEQFSSFISNEINQNIKIAKLLGIKSE